MNVGTDHDTPVFAVTSIETWWKRMGIKRYPDATEIIITADAGGSNGYRGRVWKFELQRLADKLGMPIHVSYFPPGTSKGNKVEHRLFSFITMNLRGKPLRTYETNVSLIGNTTNGGGLVVNDEEVLRAMALAFVHLRIVLEPGGAVALAAALFRQDLPQTVIAVASGGNVDPALFRRALEQHAT